MAALIVSNSQQMRALRRSVIILALIAAAYFPALAAQKSASIPAQLRQRLLNSVGKIPWNPADGYALEGQFILKATGEEIPYRIRYARASNRWVSDFSQADPSRNLRYAFSNRQAWVASPEITADLKPENLPYMAQFDFYQLYEALLGILERGTRDPSFAAEAIANEIHVKGKLQNGWEATFVFNIVDYFPRKVSVTFKEKSSAAWLLPFIKPDGSSSLLHVPGLSTGFEIWMSDPVDTGEYRYARRMDFVEGGNVIGTMFLDRSLSITEDEALFNRPPDIPWAESMGFKPRADSTRPSLYLNAADLPAFRSRIEGNFRAGWNRTNRLVAFWAKVIPWIGFLIPPSISFRLISLTVAIFLVGLTLLLLRRRRQTADPFRWSLLLAGLIMSCLILLGWVASRQLHGSRDRSLIALHSALRYAATGHSSHARSADALLLDFESEAPAQSIEDLGHSCQAYALAYDLIRSDLTGERQMQIEKDLFDYALPLFGASRGWRSNMNGSSVISAGLGMAGLAVSYEPYISAACEVMDKTLETQLVGGLHQSGPGPGSAAMDSAINFFYGLKNAGRADYYSHVSFRKYLDTTLQMLSPVGTLPLFGDTSLDQSARLSAFFLKTANQLPDETGRQCIAAYNRYWAHGRYHAGGWIKWILPPLQSAMMFFKNPYLFLQYTREISPSFLRSASAILGDGQLAVLRTGEGPDSAYLALNMTRSNYATHKDILTFDMYAYRSLLLNGPGFPGKEHPGYRQSAQTAASNSITLNGEDQSATRCTGIESSLINQPTFDYMQALADKTYDYGHVRRDIIMARPEKDHPVYFLLFDDVFVSDQSTTVQWYLHGRGKLATGIAQISRWTAAVLDPPRLWPNRVILEASYPIGIPGNFAKTSGVMYSQVSLLNQISEGTIIEWMGSGRFCSVLAPRRPGEAQAKIEALGKGSYRIGATDWVSLGRLDTQVTAGPLKHISEYTIVRDRQQSFPALLMVSGLECRFHSHSLTSSKPVTASLKDLHGGFLNSRPDTRIEIHSPAIKGGDRFRLDDQAIVADEAGALVFMLENAGEHSLHPAN
jgi:hypothetical protein